MERSKEIFCFFYSFFSKMQVAKYLYMYAMKDDFCHDSVTQFKQFMARQFVKFPCHFECTCIPDIYY